MKRGDRTVVPPLWSLEVSKHDKTSVPSIRVCTPCGMVSVREVSSEGLLGINDTWNVKHGISSEGIST